MRLTKEQLSSKYDYNPASECFHYKASPFKRVDWNTRKAGKEVKPLQVGNDKYLVVNNALYSVFDLIQLWNDENYKRCYPTTIKGLLKKRQKVQAAIGKMSVDELTKLINQIKNDEPNTISNMTAKK